ncbi:MAG TPA: HNH endonuclease signature motif containing protein, partial [Mycobacteriales bacterium]|nr:HNH endonuclease signature motif containing protein [Mycobacteriales bacterium]
DAHHVVPLSEGGPTVMDNLVLLCRRHHRLWHHDRLHRTDLHVPWLDQLARRGPPVEALLR